MKDIDYPSQWDELPKRERKKKIRELKKKKQKRAKLFKKLKNIGIIVVVIAASIGIYKLTTKESPEEAAFKKEVQEATLDGRVETSEIEGREHVTQKGVEYKTNPPTSGAHFGQPTDWGVYSKELVDESVVHSLEHGGIWISYKDISDEEKTILEEIGKENPQSVIVSPRSANDANIAVVSWGKLMKLEKADKALIQKYINTHINQSPEQLAR